MAFLGINMTLDQASGQLQALGMVLRLHFHFSEIETVLSQIKTALLQIETTVPQFKITLLQIETE